MEQPEQKKKRGRPKKLATSHATAPDESSRRKSTKKESRKSQQVLRRLLTETQSQYAPEALWLVQTAFVQRQLGNGTTPLWYLETPVFSDYSGYFLDPLLMLESMPKPKPAWLEILCQIRLLNGRTSFTAYKKCSCRVAFTSDCVERSPPGMTIAYSLFQEWQLPQVNELLSREFWPGVQAKDHLRAPEFTVVVLFQKLVVGCVFSSPDGYITYFYIRPGWRQCGLGKRLLYFLIANALSKSITLHVSVNNPALLLYQQMGFKPEEFIIDFYDKYLPASSQQCKNAYYIRLRL